MADFLLELLSEEIPARMQAKARADLAKLLTDQLAAAGLKPDSITTYATPRRLALIAHGLPDSTAAVSEETKGPPADAPDAAIDGFLKKTGLSRDALVARPDAKGRQVLFAIVEKPGQATADLLTQAIPAIIRAFPWPKSMRWGDASISTESLRWVRPLQGIVALFGDTVVPVEIAGVQSSAATVGHRFHHPGAITIGSASDYVEKLRACHVIVDQDERAAIIRDGANAAASAAGLTMIPDEGLVTENAGLNEWPVPLLGTFDPAFLEVPPEVIQLTARVNQKYFVCENADGKLAPAFVCVANIAAADGGAKIVEGNQKVLAARLSDARFFWEQDLKVALADQLPKLEKIVFHEKLGTVADKVDRVAKLARWLVEEKIVIPAQAGTQDHRATNGGTDAGPVTLGPGLRRDDEVARLADLAEQAARLAKADLVTQMVGEFPELQGLIGGYLAAAQGLPSEVAEAIRDHYKPVGQGDNVPTAPVTVAVSLADKLDTIAAFYCIGEKPTGSKDPFALRRAAMGVIQLLLVNNARERLVRLLLSATYGWYQQTSMQSNAQLFTDVYFGLEQAFGAEPDLEEVSRLAEERAIDKDELRNLAYTAVRALLDFFADRLKVQQREAGVRHDLIDAVFALGGEDDLVRLLARVRALQSFMGSEDGTNLLAGYKRAANILKKEGVADAEWKPLSYTPEIEENALITALDAAEPKAAAAIQAEDFEGAMSALATLRAPIDAFFDKVTVNDPAPEKREARLALLARMRAAVHQVADFSRIEG